MVTKLNPDMYKAETLKEAVLHAKQISESENDSFSIIISRDSIFIERGLEVFIRSFEKLIVQYSNGNLRSWT